MKNVKVIDLSNSQDNYIVSDCEICIIGGGAAGIYLATELVRKGVDTILLEAGGKTTTNSTSAGFDIYSEGELYLGATQGRYFGLGGTTAHWGGVLVPHTKYDLRSTNDTFDVWKHIIDIVDSKSESVLGKLGWIKDSGFINFHNSKVKKCQKLLNTTEISSISALHLPFRNKNLIFLLKRLSKNNHKLQIYINSVVYDWKSTKGTSNEKVQSIKAKSINGNQLLVNAKKYIVSAGAIESARILLELNQSSSRSVIKDTAAVGYYLSDHISIPVAKVDKASNKKVIEYFSPYFSHGWLRSFRFIEGSYDYEILRSFFHFVYKNESVGFSLAKEFLTAMQSIRKPQISIQFLFSGIFGIIKLGFYRYIYSVLHIPKNTEILLQLDIEQYPSRDSCIKLGKELDKYGRQIAKIRWKVSEKDIHNIKLIKEKFLKKFSAIKGIKLHILDDNANIFKSSDTYHPVGVCCMGKKKESVVDENLKVYGTENLWVVSTGVLPSAGSANPTFTMLCLADRLVEQITQKELWN